MKYYLPLLFFCLFSGTSQAQNPEGDWYGSLTIPIGEPLPIIFHFQKDDKGDITGTWDSPKQNALGLPFTTIIATADSLIVSIDNIRAKYRGYWVAGDSIAGTWQQGSQTFPLNFSRKAPADAKPQIGIGKDMVIRTRDQKEIHGSLVAGEKDAPLVIIVAGSGPTDRDGNQQALATNAYLMMAQALDSAHIQSFRYDKRGVGKSASAMLNESDLRFDTYVNDLIDIIQYFKNNGHQQIFVAGHSEGALIGMAAAGKMPISGLISLSGAGFPANEVLKKQLEAQPLSAEKKQQIFKAIDSLKKGETVSGLPADMDALFRKAIQPYLISWFSYDPRHLIAELSCPVLILQGTCDIQVDVSNATALFDAATAKGKIEVVHNMTHVLKDAGKDCEDQMKTYSNASMPLAPGFMKFMIDFIRP